jgi:hypothetical protein
VAFEVFGAAREAGGFGVWGWGAAPGEGVGSWSAGAPGRCVRPCVRVHVYVRVHGCAGPLWGAGWDRPALTAFRQADRQITWDGPEPRGPLIGF